MKTAVINQAGAAQAARFALHQPSIVRDLKTGLMWDAREFDSVTMEQAKAHIVKLNAEKFGGHDDWRLPERDELLSLVDLTRYGPAIDTAAFPQCKRDWYWSATPLAQSPGGCAWLVNFSNGYAGWHAHASLGFVRAVRVGQ